jgi:aspartate/glutamate racemase
MNSTSSPPRVALIHALAHSVAPINEALDRQWPDALRVNLLDDSLSADLARQGGVLDEAMQRRFECLADYVVAHGAGGILFTCSAFGPCIDAVARRHPTIPVLKPNEAMVEQASALSQPIGLIATFAPTLRSMPAEFAASSRPVCALAEGALEALGAGDGAAHDRAILAVAQRLRQRGCGVIALAQFSMARAAPLLREVLDCPVLTTPDSAADALRRRMATPE